MNNQSKQMKNTKIICTLGPSSETKAIISSMIKNGMDIARLNFSHGDHKKHKKLIQNIRIAAKTNKTQIPIIQDLQGPKIRIGKLKEPTKLKKDQKLTLHTKLEHDEKNIIPITDPSLPKDLKKGDTILINDGLIELTVTSINKEKTGINCKVITPGLLTDNKGLNVPTNSISTNPITAKDEKDLKFGIKQKVDFIALSFVRNSKDIRKLRRLITKYKGNQKIIAKIERHEAIKNIKEIIEESDAIMIARGDMGVEIPPEQVPITQKKIIVIANKLGKPVITATHMMQSMIDNPRPTRAEISDVANAVYDHTDCVMLSNESAIGKYPLEAVDLMSKTISATENQMEKSQYPVSFNIYPHLNPIEATCHKAVELADNINADFLVINSQDGSVGGLISQYKPYTPTIIITNSEKTQRQLSLAWGLNRFIIKSFRNIPSNSEIIKLLKWQKIAKKGQKIVILQATNDFQSISTDTI